MKLSEYIPYYRRNLQVALPVMLTGLGNALMGMVDSMMVGHFSTTHLAAVSISNCIFFTAMVFGLGAVCGITPLVGQVYVQGLHRRVSSLWRNGLIYTLLLSFGLMAVLFALFPCMPLMGQDPDVVNTARPYYLIITVSSLPFLLFNFEKSFLEGLGNTMVAMLITIFANVLNIILNSIFIYGLLGCPELGATGAGISTFIGRSLQPFIYYAIIRHRPDWCRYTWHKVSPSRLSVSDVQRDHLNGLSEHHTECFLSVSLVLRELKGIAKVGLPIGLQQMMEIFAFTFAFIVMGWISKETVAAHTISNNISDLTFLVMVGIGAATTIRVSHQYGVRNFHAVRMAANASIHLSLLFGLLTGGLIITFRQWIPMAYSNDPLVIPIAAELLIFCGLFQVFDAMQCVGGAMLRGITDVRWPMVMALVCYILIAVPVGLLLTFPLGLGAKGMWIGFMIGLALAAIALHWRFRLLLPRLPELYDSQYPQHEE